MAYFKSEDSYAQRQKNEGFFRLDDCISIIVVGEYQGFKMAFAIQGPRQKHILVAESRYASHEKCVCVCVCICVRAFICSVCGLNILHRYPRVNNSCGGRGKEALAMQRGGVRGKLTNKRPLSHYHIT